MIVQIVFHYDLSDSPPSIRYLRILHLSKTLDLPFIVLDTIKNVIYNVFAVLQRLEALYRCGGLIAFGPVSAAFLHPARQTKPSGLVGQSPQKGTALGMEDLVEKIKKTSFTKKEQQIAEYVIEHLNTVGFETVTSIAKAIGVSDASVIRFVRTLGYESFSAFKKQMNDRMLQQYNNVLSANELYHKTMSRLNEGNLITDLLEHSIDNLRSTALALKEADLELAVQLIMNSQNKYVIGFRGSSTCASFMARKLIYLTNNVTLCPYAESHVIERIFDIGPQDCIVLYSFQRYSDIVYPLLEIAKEKQTHVVVITDNPTYPPAPWADVILPASVSGMGFVNSYIAALYITDLLLLMASKYPNLTKRIELLDKFINKTKLY